MTPLVADQLGAGAVALAALRTLKGFLSRVRPLVTLQAHQGAEFLPTLCAGVRAQVALLVVLEDFLGNEVLPAVDALMRLLPRVVLLMQSEVHLLAKPLPTLGTAEGLHARMNEAVRVQIRLLAEPFPAVRALKGLLPSVREHVGRHVLAAKEPFPTLAALVGSFSGVDFLVGFQVLTGANHFPALVTLEASRLRCLWLGIVSALAGQTSARGTLFLFQAHGRSWTWRRPSCFPRGWKAEATPRPLTMCRRRQGRTRSTSCICSRGRMAATGQRLCRRGLM